MSKKTGSHPAIDEILRSESAPHSDGTYDRAGAAHTTSVSLARALAVGGISRLDPSVTAVNIWDPAAGQGFAGFLLVQALRSSGVNVCYRGQDINRAAVAASRRRFEAVPDAKIAEADTLATDPYKNFRADLVIVDAPWGMHWRQVAAAVEKRQSHGDFRFGLPQSSDSTWLFISLALEKLRPAEQGGGRVAALVNPGSLSSGGATGAVRQRIVDAGLLESATRLPDGLAPNTSIPLYLLTFSNKAEDVHRGTAIIANLQTMFTTEHRHKSIPAEGFRELESGLRTRKTGPRNRTVSTRYFTRRDVRLSRIANTDGRRLSWRVTTYCDTPIDDLFVQNRYGPDSGVSLDGEPRETIDLDPSRMFGDDSRELLRDMATKGWPSRRLSSLIAREPEVLVGTDDQQGERHLFVPTSRDGRAALELSDAVPGGRVLAIQLDDSSVYPPFITAWLNSDQGIASRLRAIENGSSGHHFRALLSDANSLMRWADELLVPVPNLSVQLALASADRRLGSYQIDLETQRAGIWASPDNAADIVAKVATAFDDSLTAWLDELPFPIASALWTAETAGSPGDQQRAYLHAWEAIVTFHATVLLSASRSDPGGSSEIEASIRQTLAEQRLGIERASFGTWVVIIEKTSKRFRQVLDQGDADETARVRRTFGDLGRAQIERLVSKDLVSKFKELNGKRNRWLGHTGYTSEQEWTDQVNSLVSDLSELRRFLGNVWSQLQLVRPRSAKRGRGGILQTAEVAVGIRTPFKTRDFGVGELMIDGELYLVRDGSQSPLRLGHFVQLRASPSSAQFTTYFYNRTEGSSVRMVSYQYGPESEVQDNVESLQADFGELGFS